MSDRACTHACACACFCLHEGLSTRVVHHVSVLHTWLHPCTHAAQESTDQESQSLIPGIQFTQGEAARHFASQAQAAAAPSPADMASSCIPAAAIQGGGRGIHITPAVNPQIADTQSLGQGCQTASATEGNRRCVRQAPGWQEAAGLFLCMEGLVDLQGACACAGAYQQHVVAELAC